MITFLLFSSYLAIVTQSILFIYFLIKIINNGINVVSLILVLIFFSIIVLIMPIYALVFVKKSIEKGKKCCDFKPLAILNIICGSTIVGIILLVLKDEHFEDRYISKYHRRPFEETKIDAFNNIFCPKCGRKVEIYDAHCPSCGSKII